VLRLAVRQAAKAPSFAEASDDLRELVGVSISATHLQRLCERVGPEWAQARDEEVAHFRQKKLPPVPAAPATVAAVMLDGGRVQTRWDTWRTTEARWTSRRTGGKAYR
jgi:hypothetical protein